MITFNNILQFLISLVKKHEEKAMTDWSNKKLFFKLYGLMFVHKHLKSYGCIFIVSF